MAGAKSAEQHTAGDTVQIDRVIQCYIAAGLTLVEPLASLSVKTWTHA